jgi:hypothetical protein
VCYVQIAIAAVGIMMQMKASADQEAARRDKATFDAQIAKNNSKILNRQADDAEEKGKDDRYLARLKADVARERMQAELAGQRFDVTFGTNIDLLAEMNEFGERDANAIKESADQTAFALRARAANFAAQGTFEGALASGASPGDAALSTGVSGATSVASKWYPDIASEFSSTSTSSAPASGADTSLLATS